MKPLYSEEEYEKCKNEENLQFECEYCGEIFYKKKKYIKTYLKHKLNKSRFCGGVCAHKSKITSQNVTCKNCGKDFLKLLNQFKKYPNHFCSSSCAATYNNQHKTNGNRRSKLEIWLETQLPILYPNIEFHFNRKDTINSELDIYIPSLSLAFELNGIFHYEPIYGKDKLNQIKNNDNRKFQACLENKIELVLIDSSKQIHFKESTSKLFLDIITNIINNKLSEVLYA